MEKKVKKVILCVDDEKIILNSLRTQLKLLLQNEFEYEFAEDGAEALSIISELKSEYRDIAIIFSDYIMPKMKGDEFLSRAHELVPDAKKILLSGQATLESVQFAINEAKLFKYMSKPWLENDLFQTIQMATLESTKQEAERAIASSLSKSQFLANMSHEIRTPLNGIIGMLQLLNGTELSDEQKRFTNIASISSENLLSLINDILDFSKIDAGKLQLEKIEFNIRESIEELIEILSFKAREKQIKFYSLIEPKLPKILGDPVRLKQIITNLLSNAIKFTFQGEVKLILTKLNESDSEIELKIEVIDTGIGIPDSKVGKLFSAFTQVDASTTRKFGGTGLGLAISKELTELMDGNINVESKEKLGSNFWFTAKFPIAKKESNYISFKELSKNFGIIYYSNNNHETTLNKFKELDFDIKITNSLAHSKDLLIESIREKRIFYFFDSHLKSDYEDFLDFAKQYKNLISVKLLSLGEKFVHDEIFKNTLFKPLRTSNLESFLQKQTNTLKTFDENENHETVKLKLRNKFNILIVDDDMINQTVASKLIAKFGYKSKCISDGIEAIEEVENNQYDLILMDCNMPEMDGWEATKKIRSKTEKTYSKIPILALTADAMDFERKKSYDSGMNDIITKPFKSEQLIEHLDKYLGIK